MEEAANVVVVMSLEFDMSRTPEILGSEGPRCFFLENLMQTLHAITVCTVTDFKMELQKGFLISILFSNCYSLKILNVNLTLMKSARCFNTPIRT